jgi:hypothetical protein
MAVEIDIRGWRNADGGFGPVPGAGSEVEATAMVCLAFDDDLARAWLADAQQSDGSLGLQVGSVVRDATALGALALHPGPQRERALDYLVSLSGNNGGDSTVTTAGWPWTLGSHGWTEPTAWGLMAARHRPSASNRFADALAFFHERECAGGGWNHGSPEALGVNMGPYVQTTAVALLALADDEPALAERGVRVLERTWRAESVGVLTLATATCALQRARSADARNATDLLRSRVDETTGDAVVSAWFAFAEGALGPWEAS